MKQKISAVYKIVNTITGECYVGSSKDVKERWNRHKCPSTWKVRPNSLLYHDFQKYGLNCFRFQILTPVIPEYLKQVEQELIEMLHPTYNNNRASGWDVERHKETNRKSRETYNNQLCFYNGKSITLNALAARFFRAGIEHPAIEAKKYLKNS